MPIPSYDQILALAPDESSAKSGRELAVARKWLTLGFTDGAVWGSCQGSGANPYQTGISLADNTFKCSCPSRKFPCKHGLGLYLLLSREQSAFMEKDPPGWLLEWLGAKYIKQEKKAKKQEVPAKPVDLSAQAKRQSERMYRVKGGTDDLDRWMQDLIRHGLASAQSEPFSFWESQAKRLVDAQAPGLARLVRQCAGTASSGDGWQGRLMQQLANIYLLVQANERFDELSLELKADVKTALGFTTDQDEVLASQHVTDQWIVLAQRVEQEDKLRMQRTWLVGTNTQRHDIVLSFAHGTATLDASLLAGFTVEADLSFFPSAYPLRALLKRKGEERDQVETFKGSGDISLGMESYSTAIATNPWIERFPFALEAVVPTRSESNDWFIRDVSGTLMPLAVSALMGWQLLSASEGRAISVFGEFDGTRLEPLSILAHGSFYRL